MESDFHGRLIERGYLSSCIAHKNVQRTKLRFDAPKHSGDFFHPADIRLHDETFRAAFPNSCESYLRCGLILIVVDSNLRAALRELDCDSTTNSSGATRNQCIFSLE